MPPPAKMASMVSGFLGGADVCATAKGTSNHRIIERMNCFTRQLREQIRPFKGKAQKCTPAERVRAAGNDHSPCHSEERSDEESGFPRPSQETQIPHFV